MNESSTQIMEFFARPLHRYPVAQPHSINQIPRVSVPRKHGGNHFTSKVESAKGLQLRKMFLHSSNKGRNNAAPKLENSINPWSDRPRFSQAEKDLTSSRSKLILWEFPSDNETLYGVFPWIITIGIVLFSKSPPLRRYRFGISAITKISVGVVPELFSQVDHVALDDSANSLPRMVHQRVLESHSEILQSAEFDMDMCINSFLAPPKLSNLGKLNLFPDLKLSCSYLIHPQRASAIFWRDQRNEVEDKSHVRPNLTFVNYLFLQIHCELNFEHLVDPLISSSDESLVNAFPFIPKHSDSHWNLKTLRKIEKGAQIVPKFILQAHKDYENVLFPTSTNSGKLIHLFHDYQRKGLQRHLWCRFSFQRFDVRLTSYIFPIVYVPRENFERKCFSVHNSVSSIERPIKFLLLVHLTSSIRPNVAALILTVAPPVDVSSNETEKVREMRQEEQQFPLRKNPRSAVREKSISKQVEHYISKNASGVFAELEKERKRWFILVSESFYETFPNVVTDLLTKYSIQSIDYKIDSAGISAILDPAVGVFLIAEEEILDRERFRIKLKEIIKASFQYYRLWILILQRSIARSFSNERVILLCQSVAKLPCKVCVRTCPFNDHSIAKLLSRFCLQTFNLAEETFLKPEVYNQRDFLLQTENPRIAAQIYVLQKFPMINAFLAAALLNNMQFVEIVSSTPEQLKLILSKFSAHPKEVEEVLESFHEAVNQFL